jgi:nicotinamidase-related amidase
LGACDLSTHGPRIGSYGSPKRALLVLDVQKDFTGIAARMPVDRVHAQTMIGNINKIIAKFRERGDVIIYVRNVFGRYDIGNVFRNFAAVQGSPGVAFDDRLTVVSDLVFDKSRPDAFSNGKLESLLYARRISEITVTGVFADQCAYWTSRGALNRGYKVSYVADAVAARSAEDIDRAARSLKSHGATIVRTSD